MKMTLKAWRLSKEISQQKMADYLGIHINTYQKWERTPQNISISNAQKIAEILGVSVDDISFIEG